jgi:hypothetical protein
LIVASVSETKRTKVARSKYCVNSSAFPLPYQTYLMVKARGETQTIISTPFVHVFLAVDERSGLRHARIQWVTVADRASFQLLTQSCGNLIFNQTVTEVQYMIFLVILERIEGMGVQIQMIKAFLISRVLVVIDSNLDAMNIFQVEKLILLFDL